MSHSQNSLALTYREYGNFKTVLKLEERTLPPLGDDDVLLRILAAPINPADMGRVNGSYGKLSTLPAVGGMEGVAEVTEVGSAVTQWSVGNRVIVSDAIGSWQSHAITRAGGLFRAPENVPIEQAAMAWVNPHTAWHILHDFTSFKPGDWIIQNAATSAVGKLLIQFARHKGIKTINLVRDASSTDLLKKLGADVVIADGKHAAKAALEATGGKKPKLGLNSVGASSAYTIAKCLDYGSSLVTIGAMDRAMAPFPTRYLIFNDLRLRGFWMNKFKEIQPRDEANKVLDELYEFMEMSNTQVDIAATYPLEQYDAALKHAFTPGKPGKVLFKMD